MVTSKNYSQAIWPADAQAALDKVVRQTIEYVGGSPGLLGDVLATEVNNLAAENQGFAGRTLETYAGGDVKAEDLNRFMRGLLYDIYNLYLRFKRSRNIRAAREVVKHAGLNDTESQYARIKEKVKRLEYLLAYPDLDRARLLSFADGNRHAEGEAAQVDPETGRLRLSYAEKDVGLDATVTFTPISNGTLIQDPAHDPEDAIDNDPLTYWSTSFLADAPLPEVDFPVGNSTFFAETGKKLSGAVGYLELTFPKPIALSCIKLLPFGLSPLIVADISYKAGNQDYRQVSGFSSALATPNNDYLIFQFATSSVSSLRITLAQPNYRDLCGLLKDADIKSASTIESLLGDNPAGDIYEIALAEVYETLEKVGANPKEDLESAIASVTKALERLGGNDTESEIKGCMYSIGLYDLRLLSVSCERSGYYRSITIPNENDIFRVRLAADEFHPLFEDTDGNAYIQTTADWVVDIGRGRAIPILPIGSVDTAGTPFVRLERLAGRNSTSAQTRWPIDDTKFMDVRVNGAAASGYQVDAQDKTLIRFEYFDPNLIYTISYYPLVDETHGDPSDILISDYASSVPQPEEIYEATDENGIIQLQAYPYIAREIISDVEHFSKTSETEGRWNYNGARWTILAYADSDSLHRPQIVPYSYLPFGYSYYEIDGRLYGNLPDSYGLHADYEPIVITIGGIKAQNITNYSTGNHPPLLSGEKAGGTIQYIHEGKQLTFAGKIEGEIRIQYSTLVERLELKGRLGCERVFPRDVTPLVKEAVLLTAGRL